MRYQCKDCASWFDSQLAAEECFRVDAEEARDARRPNVRTVRSPSRWFKD